MKKNFHYLIPGFPIILIISFNFVDSWNDSLAHSLSFEVRKELIRISISGIETKTLEITCWEKKKALERLYDFDELRIN